MALSSEIEQYTFQARVTTGCPHCPILGWEVTEAWEGTEINGGDFFLLRSRQYESIIV